MRTGPTRLAIERFVAATAAAIATAAAAASSCPADLNGDGVVNGADLAILLQGWGRCPPKPPCPGDITGDGMVGGADLGVVLQSWGACPEPSPTRFVGTVLLEGGGPVADATIVTDLGGLAISAKDGSFDLEFEPPEGTGSVLLTATATIGQVAFEGSVLAAPIAFGEVNEVGPIVLVAVSDCLGGLGWTSEFAGSGMNGAILATVIVDDGSGPVLFAGGEFTEADGTAASRIARWDGEAWSPVGGGMNGFVAALVEFDDGSGPALYAGGGFSTAGGVAATGIARWDGEAWSSVGGGVQGSVRSLAVYDDGSGPVLFAGGFFASAGGVPAASIAKWDGTAWSPLGGGMLGFVEALEVFDDGSGPSLFAGGLFVQAGGVPGTAYAARWSGGVWSPLGGGMNNPIYSLLAFDDGTGPALYAGGAFTLAGGVPADRIARWDGVAWSPLASGMNSTVRSLAAFDDGSGSGPAIYAAGFFTIAGGSVANRVARWMDGDWEAVGSGLDGTVMSLSVLETPEERGLIAGGYFSAAGGEAASRLAAWTCLDR
jgi:hypothetical protein